MLWDRAKPFLAYSWTLIPMYGIERLANYYFLNRDPMFYLISGWRLEVFILTALLGSAAAGAFLKDVRQVIVTQVAALVTFLSAAYVLCDPRVCYSTAPDGLEALRFGLFLASVVVSGGVMGVGSRGVAVGRLQAALGACAGFYAVAYYPTVFTFAGARLLPPFDPWATAAVLLLASLATSMGARSKFGRAASFAIPVASYLLLLALSSGIALGYLGSLTGTVSLTVAATLAGAGVGVGLVAARSRLASTGRSLTTALSATAIILVLVMTLVVIPDAVSGVVPGDSGQSAGTFSMVTPVYAGAYENSSQGHAYAAGVTISFRGTDPASIQADNFVSAGIGIHSAGCCVDGIDYAYRFDEYLFHSGNVSLAATGWEACDDNAACGGHSWKILLVSRSISLGAIDINRNITLEMKWSAGRILWVYSQDGTLYRTMTIYQVPQPENHDFNTGVSSGVSQSSQKAAYFYQFGVMSRYPVGHAGWKVEFVCPYLIFNGIQACAGHAATLRGEDSYWKVIWRWGEDYPNVSVSPVGSQGAVFEYSAAAPTPGFQKLW
ncbi:MAG: hypothetical protein KGI38_07560 [Thaumarchaeota archaeon]|nr:hypothetical protein [Nitrososphaerota archaeon]